MQKALSDWELCSVQPVLILDDADAAAEINQLKQGDSTGNSRLLVLSDIAKLLTLNGRVIFFG